MLVSAPQEPMTGCKGTAQSWAWGGSDWLLGTIYLSEVWSITGTGFLARWLVSVQEDTALINVL